MGCLLSSRLAMLEQWHRPSPNDQRLISHRKASQCFQPLDRTNDSHLCGNHIALSPPHFPPLSGGGLTELPPGPLLHSQLFCYIQWSLGCLRLRTPETARTPSPLAGVWQPQKAQPLSSRSFVGSCSSSPPRLPTQIPRALAGAPPWPTPLFPHVQRLTFGYYKDIMKFALNWKVLLSYSCWVW